MLPTRTSVWTASGLFTMTTRRVGLGGSANIGALTSRRSQSPNTRRTLANASSADMSPTIARMRVVRREVLLVERDEVVARDRPRASPASPICGRPYGWNPYTSRSNTAFAMKSGSSKLTCSDDSNCCRWRAISSVANAGWRAMSDSIFSPLSKLSFITSMLTKLRSVPAPAFAPPPMKSIASFNSLAAHGRRALIEERRGQVCETGLAFRIERAAGADEQPDADDRLLVVRDGDDLQAVRQRLHFVRREVDGTRRAADAAETRSAR